MFDFLGPFHPQIVHTPVALLIFSAFFSILGHVMDRDWLKKTAVLLLVFGLVGSFLAEQSGKPAHRVPEREQGVPEDAIHEHSDAAEWVTRTAAGALVALGIATRLKGGARTAVTGLALLLQVMAAVAVGRTALLGGKLTYDHGANVRVDGQLVKSANAGAGHREGAMPGEGHVDSAGAPPHRH
jgi:uncharacterized membrane protein